MNKRTLYFGNPCYLSKKQNQLSVELEDKTKKSVPIEDIGMVILDHYQIKITQPVLQALVSSYRNQCFFLRNDVAISIYHKFEFSSLNKMEMVK